MYHFFVTAAQIDRTHCHITGQDVNHIKNVLRMKPGDRIAVRDGISRNYICEIDSLGAREVTARILSSEEESSELISRLYLFQAIPKGDKMDGIVRKAVELGACEVIPVAARRCVVRLDAKKAEAKVLRWNAVAESAAKQCGRSYIPSVRPVMGWSQAVACAGGFDMSIIPYELAEGIVSARNIIAKARPGMRIGIFIGPEGGFDTEEVEEACRAGIYPITLGRRILRTETAGLAALSILMFHLEE